MNSRDLRALLWPDALVWLLLLVLLFASLGLAYVRIGWGNAVNYAVAAAMAALVTFFLMHLRRSSTLVRLVAAIGVFWMMIIFSLTFSDFLTREASVSQPGAAFRVVPP